MRITVVGTGYVGLVTATVMSDLGHVVTCFDVDINKIKRLQNGDPIIHEDGLAELMGNNKQRLIFTSDICEAYRSPEAVFICVGTPEDEDGSANLDYVYGAIDQVVDNVSNDIVLIIKSTVPIGTNDKLQEYIDQIKYKSGKIEVVSNPEFLSQGTAVKNMQDADRIIIGTRNEKARFIMGKIYEDMNVPIIYTDRCSAEMIKYASNDFLALKISYINEIANLCEILGANINDVAEGMGMDPRIGNKFLNAGIGYGGSCFPKDTKALCSLADTYGYDLKTVKAAIDVNERQKLRLLEKSRKYYKTFEGVTVAVLGLTFKPGTDDLRESPALMNIPKILGEGGSVQVYDPVGMSNYKKVLEKESIDNNEKIIFCNTPQEALNNADICLILTEWPEIRELTSKDFMLMKSRIVLDGRNCLYDVSEELEYNAIGI